MELARDGLAWTRSGLAHAAGVSMTVVDGLKTQGIFEEVMLPPPAVVAKPDIDYARATLSEDQQAAAEMLSEAVEADCFRFHCSMA